MKLYTVVESILRNYPQTRNSDKRLIWFVWNYKEGTQLNYIHPALSKITFMSYMQMPSSESITRARRKVVENNPELKSNKVVQALKDVKESKKGMFAYHETI